MKLLGISQRIDNSAHDEIHDGLDQQWWPVILQLGYLPVPLPNLAINEARLLLAELNLSALILSGGNSIATEPKRDAFESYLLEWAIANQKPVVGVCRGLQMINHFFKGTLTPVTNHVATRHEVTFAGSFIDMGVHEVNSFHEFGVFDDDLAKPLRPLAKHQDGSIEALQHEHHKISAIMWHPERELSLTNIDKKLFEEFLND